MSANEALALARQTWPAARLRTARKSDLGARDGGVYRCDNCFGWIEPGERYIDPGDSNPDRAGGFGGYRYCLHCAGGDPEKDLL